MVPGLTERDIRVAELRRLDLLAAAMREAALPSPGVDRRPAPPAPWRHALGGLLVRAGRRLQGAGEPVATAGEAPAALPVA